MGISGDIIEVAFNDQGLDKYILFKINNIFRPAIRSVRTLGSIGWITRGLERLCPLRYGWGMGIITKFNFLGKIGDIFFVIFRNFETMNPKFDEHEISRKTTQREAKHISYRKPEKKQKLI